MTKTTKAAAPKKTPRKKIEAAVENVVEEIKEEATEPVGTITLKRWQAALMAGAMALAILTIVF